MLLNLPITLLIALYVAGFYTFFGIDSVLYSMGIGVDLAVFVCLFTAMQYLYEQRPMNLFLINAGYTIVTLMLM